MPRPRVEISRARLLSVAAAGIVGLMACGHAAGAGAAPSPLEPGVLRPSQAPIVGPLEVFSNDSLLGKRVRVLGWCAGAPGILVGRRLGAWFLGTPDTIIEVRGQVPVDCGAAEAQQTLLLLFAQVVRAGPDSGERLLLRLPD
jgi:hypothetical protein